MHVRRRGATRRRAGAVSRRLVCVVRHAINRGDALLGIPFEHRARGDHEIANPRRNLRFQLPQQLYRFSAAAKFRHR